MVGESSRSIVPLDCPDIRSSRGETSGPAQVEQDPEDRQAWFRSMWEAKAADPPPSPHQTTPHDNIEDHHEEQDNAAAVVDDDDDEDDFGDDFDDFAEGADGDDDFGDFDQADHTPAPLPLPETQHSQSAPLPSALSHFVSTFSSPLSLCYRSPLTCILASSPSHPGPLSA